MNLRFGLWLCFQSFCSASLTNFKSMFKGKNSLRVAILDRNKEDVLSILRWKSCKILMEREHSLLNLLVTTGQRKLLHEAFEGFGEEKGGCLVSATQSTLKYDDNDTLDAVLGIVKEFNNGITTGEIFKRCVLARNYRCVGIIADWRAPLTYENSNIFHFAASMDDLPLLKYAPMNEIVLDKVDRDGKYPMDHVLSLDMAKKMNERWLLETSITPPKSWNCVQSMHLMTRIFKIPDHTLIFRSSLLTNHLQRLAANPDALSYVLNVSRDSVFRDSFKAINKNQYTRSKWYRKNLKFEIEFNEEMGVDLGGPRLEWLSLMIDAMFKPNPTGSVADFTAPLFEEVDELSGMYAPTMKYDLEVYKFAGSILAIAFREKITLKVNLIPSIINVLLGSHFTNLNYLEILQLQHPTQFNGLQNLKKTSDKDIEDAGIVFEPRPIFESNPNLRPEVKVTKENLDVYIEDYAAYHTYEKYKPYLKALATGFMAINNSRLLHTIFNHQEMTAILRGGSSIDLESLKQHCVVTGKESSKRIFWEMMEDLNDKEKLQFFKFVTGRGSVPLEGIIGLKDKINIRLDAQKVRLLPTASTCASIIYFAEDITTAEEMKRRLLKSMEYAKEFSLA